MAANNVPLELVLRRSLNQGFMKEDDPELTHLRESQGYSKALKELDETKPTHYNGRSRRVPLSPNSETYYQPRGSLARQASTTPTTKMNTINSRRAKKAGVPVSGYGLDDFSSSEEDDSDDDDGTDDSEESEEGIMGPRKSDAANYITHLTAQLDPWEWKIHKVREETKEIAPMIAEKIESDLKRLIMRPPTAPTWTRNLDDVAQRLKVMELETQAIKEKRRMEFEARQMAMDKEVEDCLMKIREERETAIRIREEAVKQAQMEKEKAAKAEEEKTKAAIAQKQAQEKKAAEAAAAAEKAEKDKKANAVVAAQQAKNAAAEVSASTSAMFFSEAASAEYKRYMEVLGHIKAVVLPAIESDEPLLKYCGAIKREIIPNIGQLINKRDEVLRVAVEIDELFKQVMQTQNENAYYWILNITAKKMVKQAEGEALVKASPAFPLAHVAVLLFTNHPRFLDVLMARFAKKCPYATPIYMSKNPSDTPDQFFQKLAYKKKHGKGWESEAEYNARQCAMFTLYCAIIQTNPPVGQNLYSLSNGWTWMARVLNMPPRPITPSLITVFLEVCGDKYLRTYGNQARKAIQFLMSEFIPLIPPQGKDGTTRLKILLEKYLTTGQIPVVTGREFDP